MAAVNSNFVARDAVGSEQDLDVRHATADGAENDVNAGGGAIEAYSAAYLGRGTGNSVSAADAKGAVDHAGTTTGNPHNLGAADVGADPAGTAASAVSSHAGDADAHHDNSNDPTSDQKAAMAGAASPSGANVFATMNDLGAGGAFETFSVEVTSLSAGTWNLPSGWSASKFSASVLDITHNRGNQAMLMQVVDDLVSGGYKKTWPGGDPSGPIMYVADANDTDVRITGLAVLADSFTIHFVFPL